jgi:hypothetical protein
MTVFADTVQAIETDAVRGDFSFITSTPVGASTTVGA